MSKNTKNSLSSSVGFNSQASGFTTTLKRDQWLPPTKQMSSTQKDSVMRKVSANVQRNEERRQLIQNYLDQNVSQVNEMDFKATMNQQQFTFQRPRSAENNTVQARRPNDEPFQTRTFTKTINLLVEDFDISANNFQHEKFMQSEFKNQQNYKNQPPGVLNLRKFNYGNVYKQKSSVLRKDPVLMIQALVRRYLQRTKFLVMKKRFENTIHEHKMNAATDRMVRGELAQADKLILQLQKQKLVDIPTQTQTTPLGITKDNPFYTTVLEILGERGMLGQDDFIQINKFDTDKIASRPPISQKSKVQVKLRPNSKKNLKVKISLLEPVLKSDGLGIWEAMHKKQSTKGRLQTSYYEDDEQEQSMVQTTDIPKTKIQEKRQVERETKMKKLMAVQIPQDQLKRIDDDIGEEIMGADESIMEEDIKQSISEDVYLEEDFEVQSESGGIKESIQESNQQTSIIKESLQFKDSIQEEYGDDFEQISQSQKIIQKQPNHDNDEYEEAFESYSEQKSDLNVRKKVTFDTPSPPPKFSSSIVLQGIETQPIHFIKSKWLQDDENKTLLAKREAEFQLEKFQSKYKELRNLKFDDVAFESLKKENYDFLKVQNGVETLLHSKDGKASDYEKSKESIPIPSIGQADVLYSKFQFEMHRLLSVNTLGTKLQNIIGSIGAFDQKNNSNSNQSIPMGGIQKALYSIDQQQQIIQQVLQQVLSQMSLMFNEQSALQELRLYRQESDQKLQQLIFKQDKLLNDRMEGQLRKRDTELKKFIQDLFDKQKREFGSVKLLPSSKLQDALQRSFQAFQPSFQAPFDATLSTGKLQQDNSLLRDMRRDRSVKEDSSYQADFEAASVSEQSHRKSDIHDQSDYLQSSQSKDNNSMSADMEVNEYGSLLDIEWQNDINLFENQNQNKSDQHKLQERQAQSIVDQLTKMLLDEIRQDFFPVREELSPVLKPQSIIKEEDQKIQQAAPVIKKIVVLKEVVTKKEEEIKEVAQPPKFPQQKNQEQDDFGMGAPSFSRQDLEKEFDLTDDSVEDGDKDKSDAKKPELKIDRDYQIFVKKILDEYAKLLQDKKTNIVDKLLDLIKESKSSNQPLGGLIQRDFHFFRDSQIKEKDAQPIVHSMEEQLANHLLQSYNDSQQQDQKSLHKTLLSKVSGAIKSAVVSVMKYPNIYYQKNNRQADIKMDFETALRYTKKNAVPKECLQNYEIQETLIAQEMSNLADNYHEKILLKIVQETMGEFTTISKKRKDKK